MERMEIMIKTLIESILGIYEPVVTDIYSTTEPYEYIGSQVANGAAGVDWVYIAGCIMLALTLYCVFRIIGSLFNA